MEETLRTFRQRRRKRAILAAVILIGALLFLIPAYLYRPDEGEISPPAPTVPKSDEEAVAESEEGVAPSEEFPAGAETETGYSPGATIEEDGESRLRGKEAALPSLAESDQMVRDRARSLSDHPGFAAWLEVDRLLPRVASLADNAASGLLARNEAAFLAPQTGFSAVETEQGWRLDPASYRRYDGLVAVFSSINADAAASFYRTFKPLIEQAYGRLGYPEEDFEKALRKAFATIQSAPRLEGEIALVRPSVTFQFADPELENLNPLHKQLIRMGPENTLKIQETVKRLSGAIFPRSASEMQ